jgi:hypothetical protein
MIETALKELSLFWREQAEIFKKQEEDWRKVRKYCSRLKEDLCKDRLRLVCGIEKNEGD